MSTLTPVDHHMDLHSALQQWIGCLGADRVVVDQQAVEAYRASTIGVQREVPAVLKPQSAAQIPEILRIARECGVPLYTVSTGRNWGYGSANPVTDGCVILNLSGLNRILEFDPELGLVTIEPGVTAGQLHQFLVGEDQPYYVPVHGGGPDCSLLGNALERGYGITPHADHFGSLTSFEAVLPDGSHYRSALTEAGGQEIDRCFKWGLGPFLDGLFAQGNFGIVTQGTIALARAAAHAQAFFFTVKQDERLEEAVLVVRDVLRSLGTVSSSLNLMNAERVLSMVAAYPSAEVSPGQAIPRDVIGRLARENDVAAWTGAGCIYGERKLLRAARSIIRRRLKHVVDRSIFFDRGKIQTLRSWGRLLPARFGGQVRKQLEAADQFLDVVTGVPQRVALPLAYWKSGRRADTRSALNPARDRCGLIWYSPLIPMRPATVRQYVDMVNRVCPEYGIDPLITLTSLTDRLFDSTVPILFRQESPREVEQAEACYLALLEAGREFGCLPYRVGVNHMQHMIRPDTPYWQLVATLKDTLDPQHIISPGRYTP